MSTALVPMADIERMAQAVAKSGLFGMKTMDQALALMLLAQAEGMHPALAARDYHVIQGRPALKADAMLARFQQAGGMVEWQEYTDTKVIGLFSHPQACPKPLAVEWTIEMAKRIGLTGKDNWKHYPRAMLRARVISEGIRTVYPGVAVGLYTVEEVTDFAKEKNITPSSGVEERVSSQRMDEIQTLADKVRAWLVADSVGDAIAEIENAGLEADEYVFLWTHFDSKQRSAMKKENERQKAERVKAALPPPEVISDAQKKRLEARIGELKLDREAVKAWIKEQYGKEHFSELTLYEYQMLDNHIEQKAAVTESVEAVTLDVGIHSHSPESGAAAPNDAELIADIETWVKRKKFDTAFDLARGLSDATRADTLARITKAMDYVKAKEA